MDRLFAVGAGAAVGGLLVLAGVGVDRFLPPTPKENECRYLLTEMPEGGVYQSHELHAIVERVRNGTPGKGVYVVTRMPDSPGLAQAVHGFPGIVPAAPPTSTPPSPSGPTDTTLRGGAR